MRQLTVSLKHLGIAALWAVLAASLPSPTLAQQDRAYVLSVEFTVDDLGGGFFKTASQFLTAPFNSAIMGINMSAIWHAGTAYCELVVGYRDGDPLPAGQSRRTIATHWSGPDNQSHYVSTHGLFIATGLDIEVRGKTFSTSNNSSLHPACDFRTEIYLLPEPPTAAAAQRIRP